MSENIYKQMALEQNIENASGHHLIKMLFDKCVHHLAQARNSLVSTNSTGNCESIIKAISIIEYLRSCLGKNNDESIKLSSELDALYAYSIRELMNAYSTNNINSLNSAYDVINNVKSSWEMIESKVGK